MADDSATPPNTTRKTTKVAMATAFSLLAIRPLMDLKDFILGEQMVTNARIETTMKESFTRLELKMDKHVEDETSTHRRMHDLWDTQIAATEARCEKREDKADERILNLESFAMKTGRKSTN